MDRTDVLPDMFPVVSAEVAAVTWPLPAVDVSVPQAIFEREAAPLVVSLNEVMSVRVMSRRGMEVGLTGLTRDIQVLPDVFPVMIDETAAVPMPLHVVVETEPQDDWAGDRSVSGPPRCCSILILIVVLWMMVWLLLRRCFWSFL